MNYKQKYDTCLIDKRVKSYNNIIMELSETNLATDSYLQGYWRFGNNLNDSSPNPCFACKVENLIVLLLGIVAIVVMIVLPILNLRQ